MRVNASANNEQFDQQLMVGRLLKIIKSCTISVIPPYHFVKLTQVNSYIMIIIMSRTIKMLINCDIFTRISLPITIYTFTVSFDSDADGPNWILANVLTVF